MDEGTLVPLGDRWGVLQLVRLALVGFFLGIGFVAPGVAPPRPSLVLVSTVYALTVVSSELLRRVTGARGLRLLGLLLLADGLYLRAALGSYDPSMHWLELLLAVHITAVILLFSYRAGLKVTIWHTLLLVIAEILQHQAALESTAVLRIAALWTLALVTAACSSLNESELRRGRSQLAGLAAMADSLETVDEGDAIPPVLLAHTLGSFRLTRGVVVLTQNDHQTSVDLDGRGRERAAIDPLVALCLRGSESLLLRRLPAGNPGLAEVLGDARNLILVPLRSGSAVEGVLVVERGGHRFTRVTQPVLARLGRFANHAALALDKARLHEEVARLASADGLTGLPNRRSFDERIDREMARARRSGHPFSLLIIDVDHFKSVNDTYGHQAGDDVLKAVGATLGAHIRPHDFPARYGGEEFVVLLPGCDADAGLEAAERLRRALQATDTNVRPITASLGVATFPDEGAEAASLLNAADRALYHSKGSGRNRVTHARHLGAASVPGKPGNAVSGLGGGKAPISEAVLV